MFKEIELMAKKGFSSLIVLHVMYGGGWGGMDGDGMRNDAQSPHPFSPLPPLPSPFRLYITVHSDDLLQIKFVGERKTK